MDRLDNFDILYQFKDFLEEQGALKAYLTNFKENSYKCTFYLPMDFIICGFSWRKTKEGFHYWDDFAFKWDKVQPKTKNLFSYKKLRTVLESQGNNYWED